MDLTDVYFIFIQLVITNVIFLNVKYSIYLAKYI